MGEARQVRPLKVGGTMADRRALLMINLGAIAAISWLDWLTPAGVVVGILLGLPILLASTGERPLDVWITFAAAAVGFLLAATYGRDPISPESVWVPNRVLAALSLPATLILALLLQRLRRESEEAAAEAERSSDLNRLLVSLLAHDIRSPLAMAIQALEYAGDRAPASEGGLIADVRTRLRRNLATVDHVLGLARGTAEDGVETRTGADIVAEIRREAEAFVEEARTREKELEISVDGDPDRAWRIDLLVTRQTVSILVDNAIRHSLPGTIRVRGAIVGGRLEIDVEDPGPAPGEEVGAEREEGGLGLGLLLCRALVRRAGGHIDVDRAGPTGKRFAVRLPVTPV